MHMQLAFGVVRRQAPEGAWTECRRALARGRVAYSVNGNRDVSALQ